MKTSLILAFIAVAAIAASAKENLSGTIVSESSVQCGTETKSKKQSIEMMCQEYVIRIDTTEYHVRQEKEAHKELLPVNAAVEATINKDKMKFKVNGKSYEMLIVSEAAASTPAAPAGTSKP
jgi:predicted P-loop ATPase